MVDLREAASRGQSALSDILVGYTVRVQRRSGLPRKAVKVWESRYISIELILHTNKILFST